MKFDYRVLDLQNSPHTIAVTLGQMDSYNKTKYSKNSEINEELLQYAAKEAHESGNIYFVTFYEGDNPSCSIESNKDFFRNKFFDEFQREYLMYDFQGRIYEEKYGDRLFLTSVLYRYYDGPKENQINAINYIYKANRKKSKVEFNFIINTQENFDDVEIDDVSANWEDYPKFGQYESIIKKERGLEM